MLCDCNIKKKVVIVVYFKMASQRDSRVKFSALLRAKHKVSEETNLVEVSRTTVYAIRKIRDDGAGINRRAGSRQKTAVNRDSLWDAPSPKMFMRHMQGELRVERRLCDEL